MYTQEAGGQEQLCVQHFYNSELLPVIKGEMEILYFQAFYFLENQIFTAGCPGFVENIPTTEPLPYTRSKKYLNAAPVSDNNTK